MAPLEVYNPTRGGSLHLFTHIACTAVICLTTICGPLAWADDRTPTAPIEERNRISEVKEIVGQTPADAPDTPTPDRKETTRSNGPALEAKSEPVPQQPGKTPTDDKGLQEAAPPRDTPSVRSTDTDSENSDGETALDIEDAPPAPPAEDNGEPAPEPISVWTLAPDFIRPLTPIQAGHNDSNPVWSPSGKMLAFERSIGDQRKIVIALRDGTIIKTIYFQAPEEEDVLDIFLPGITDAASYNAGVSWSGNGHGLVFMSNAGSGNYDLYLLSDLLQAQPLRLTRHDGKESNPDWSPLGQQLVYVSGSTGKADIFTMDLLSHKSRRITHGNKLYLYPQWSPDGRKITMIYGSNENHDVWVIENLNAPLKSAHALTTWRYDDLRPVWSPDGSKIAFYSNYNLQGDQKMWCIIVVAADGSDIATADDLSANVVAYQVIPDIEQGPAWMPDSRHIVYVQNDLQKFNPIYLVDIEERTPIAVQTHTKMNHDVSCTRDGTLAFRAQVEQWDHIYIAKIDPEMAAIEELK
jgi:Tol biopolymer transport system component